MNLLVDLLILLDKQPEHLVELLGGVDLHLHMRFHVSDLLLNVLDTLDVMALELCLVRHQVLVSAVEVLLKLVVEGLTRDLNTDAQDDLCVHDLFFQCCVENPQVALSGLLYWVISLISGGHNLIQMDLIVEEVVKLKTLERLEHLFDILLQRLHQGLVLNLDHLLGKR